MCASSRLIFPQPDLSSSTPSNVCMHVSMNCADASSSTRGGGSCERKAGSKRLFGSMNESMTMNSIMKCHSSKLII